MRLFATLLSLAAGVMLVAAAAEARPDAQTGAAKIVIRHQVRGCHTWSFNGGTFAATLSATVKAGNTITFVDNDIMPHKLVQKSGPAVRFRGNPAMRRMGASVTVVFPKAGVYRFDTKAGEDYPAMANMKTIGEDNVLRLTVRVS